MTYEEKLARRALINKCPKELLDNVTLRVAVLKVMTELAQEATQAQREADAQCYLAAVERIFDREADSVDRDIANMILKTEVKL